MLEQFILSGGITNNKTTLVERLFAGKGGKPTKASPPPPRKDKTGPHMEKRLLGGEKASHKDKKDPTWRKKSKKTLPYSKQFFSGGGGGAPIAPTPAGQAREQIYIIDIM